MNRFPGFPLSSPNRVCKSVTIVAGNVVLAKEATKIAIWSLAENYALYKKNQEAVVALLRKPIDKWTDHSLKLLSSPSDILTFSRTMKRFRLKVMPLTLVS